MEVWLFYPYLFGLSQAKTLPDTDTQYKGHDEPVFEEDMTQVENSRLRLQ